jgi:acyl-coenzyme A thioesterase PaaI-like protein
MNRLEKQVQRLKSYPNTLLSWTIGRVVPYVGTSGVYFEKMTRNEVIVFLKNRRKVRNHIQQIHAAAMILLAETATGMAVGMNIPDDKIPLIKSMKTDFVKRSTGAMRAVAKLTDAQIQDIQTLEKGEVKVPVTITDEAQIEPILVEATWAWIPKKRKDS